MRIDHFDADPSSDTFTLSFPGSAQSLPNVLFESEFWLGNGYTHVQFSQTSSTSVTASVEGYDPGEDFITEISGEGLVVNDAGTLIAGTVTGIAFYIGARLVSEFSNMAWSATELADAAFDLASSSDISGINALLESTPLEIDATASSSIVFVNLFGLQTQAEITGSLGQDSIVGGELDDTIYGGAGNDTIRGEAGDNLLVGGAGDDQFFMSIDSGNDTVRGGNGEEDYIWYLNSGNSIELDLRDNSQNAGFAEGHVISGVENVVATTGQDLVHGDRKANFLNGVSGSDTIFGHGGNDTIGSSSAWEGTALYGGAGRDRFFCDDANGILFHGGRGWDTVDFSYNYYADSGVKVDLETPVQNAVINNATFVSIEQVIGSRYRDKLFGDDAGNILAGRAGNDRILGRAGDDTIRGQTGSDSLVGGDGDDVLIAGRGADTLLGNSGDDVLRLSRGNDIATGGEGADSFVFAGARLASDVITDFALDEDLLRLDDALWGGGLTVQQVLDQFASVVDGDLVLDFENGSQITLIDVTNAAELASDIEIF